MWAILVVFLHPWQAEASGVEWQTLTVDEALSRAAALDTLVLIDVYATWCGPCQRLDDEVFPTDPVAEATQELVNIRVDAEAGDGPQVVERFHVVGYPTVLLVRPDGVEVDRIFGFLGPADFAQTVQSYVNGEGTIESLRRQVAQDPDNLELVFELGSRSAIRGDDAEATALLEQVIEADADNARGLRSQAHHILGKYLFLRGASDYDAALEHFQVILNRFPDAPEAQDALFQTAIAYARQGNEAAANAVIEAAIAQAPDDVEVYNAIAWMCFRENFELELGLEIARRGLAIDDQADYLWDTLAELQHATGDTAGALASIQRALEISPDEEYYQGQRERFSQLAGQE